LNQLKNEIDYSSFGGTSIDENPIQEEEKGEQQKEQPKVDYSQFGGKAADAPKEKVGKFKSALLGVYEGILGIPGLVQYGVNEYSKSLEKAFGTEVPEQSFEQENPILAHLSKLPESEGQAARRFRVAGNVLPLSVIGGVPGIIAGLVGSQAGQTVREIYGKEGKFDEFGWGEVAALTTDFVTGGAAGIGVSVARKGIQSAIQEAPSIFRNAQTGLQRQITKTAVQSESNVLQGIINDFSQSQLRGFEEEAARLSPNRFTQLTQSNASGLKKNADQMFRNTQLSIISPIEATTEQAGRAIQDAANLTFRNEVLNAERTAYSAARDASKGVSGQAPKTLQEAKALRANLTRNEPTPEQKPLIAFLDGLISDLETTTPASTTPASKLLDASGKPLVQAVENEATIEATTRTANDLVDLVQRSNQAVNYGGELREQSHRLSPLISTLRGEVAEVLSQNPVAAQLYQDANLLHGRNAEIWGTRYMRNVRFAENPEQIIGSTKKASNMRNLKQGIQDPTIQGVAERAVVDQITEGGSPKANRTAVRNLSPELSPNARNSADELINVKDPLTTTGGRAAVRNDILKDAAQSVNTGKRPEKILELMQTPKGYQIVRESLNGTPQSKELFQSFQRLFLEDIVTSITDKSGVIDFSKARQIFKNPEMRQVVEQIGGPSLIRRFEQLESFANNFERNMALYSKPETQSLVKGIVGKIKNAGLITAVLHAMHIPWAVIAGLGLATGVAKVSKLTYNALQRKILSNPRAIHYLEKVSQAKTTEELAKQLPRLIAELELEED
jgi:hypothetical protein